MLSGWLVEYQIIMVIFLRQHHMRDSPDHFNSFVFGIPYASHVLKYLVICSCNTYVFDDKPQFQSQPTGARSLNLNAVVPTNSSLYITTRSIKDLPVSSWLLEVLCSSWYTLGFVASWSWFFLGLWIVRISVVLSLDLLTWYEVSCR